MVVTEVLCTILQYIYFFKFKLNNTLIWFVERLKRKNIRVPIITPTLLIHRTVAFWFPTVTCDRPLCLSAVLLTSQNTWYAHQQS